MIFVEIETGYIFEILIKGFGTYSINDFYSIGDMALNGDYVPKSCDNWNDFSSKFYFIGII